MSVRLRTWAGSLSPLAVRVLSGVALAALLVGLLAAGRVGIYAIVLVAGALALWEFWGLTVGIGEPAPRWLMYPLGLYFIFSGTVLARVPLPLVLSLALIGGLSVFLVLPGRREGLGRWAMGMAGAIYIGLPLNYWLLLHEQASRAPGAAWVLLIVATVVACDAGALLIGMRLGRHPFFPKISPHKTVEGAVGGLASCVLVALLGGVLLFHLSAWQAAVLGVLIGVTAQAGDLVESQMKRLAQVKDSSNLIPGHGGVLDRLDSLLFPPIVVYLFLSYLHLL